ALPISPARRSAHPIGSFAGEPLWAPRAAGAGSSDILHEQEQVSAERDAADKDAEVESRADGGQPDNRHDDQRRGQFQRVQKGHLFIPCRYGASVSSSRRPPVFRSPGLPLAATTRSPSLPLPDSWRSRCSPAGAPAVFGGG